MGGPAWRIVVGSLLAAALCLFARVANAAPAPYCDDRAATLLAPAPTLQPPESIVLQRAPAPPPSLCGDQADSTDPAVAPGHGPRQAPSPQADLSLSACPAPIAPPAGEPLARPTHDAPWTEDVHCRIDRPPRG